MEESFAETSILAMNFYDEDVTEWRNFAVFNVNEEQTGRQAALLFEILMEFRDFALLSRVERVKVAARRHENYLGDVSAARVGYEQFEHLCLVDKVGTATEVLRSANLKGINCRWGASSSQLLTSARLKDISPKTGMSFRPW